MQLIRLTPDSRCLDPAAAASRLASLEPGWSLRSEEGVTRLCKQYRTRDFNDAIALACRLAELADRVDHHPVLTVSWGRMELQWWTHVLHGLHENDFLMATASDSVFTEFMQNSGADRTEQSAVPPRRPPP